MVWNNADDSGFEGLSKRERECLRGVALLKSSKEIAQDLGISRHTVDKHLKSAMVVLNASSRFEAASIFMAAEGGAPGLSGPVFGTDVEDPTEPEGTDSPQTGPKGTNGANYSPQSGPKGTNGWYYQPETLGGHENRRSAAHRLSDGAQRDAAAKSRTPNQSRPKSNSINTHVEASAVDTQSGSVSKGGAGYELTPLRKLAIILASALCLIILISTTLASLTSLTQLCRTTSFCDGPTNIKNPVQRTQTSGEHK